LTGKKENPRPPLKRAQPRSVGFAHENKRSSENGKQQRAK